MIRLTHLCFQQIEKCYTLSLFFINNDELIEFSPLTSYILLPTRCDVRQCAYTFLSFLSPAISIVLYVMRVYLLYLKNLSLSWTTQNFCCIQVTIGRMTLSSTSIIQRQSPSSTCHHYILTHARFHTHIKYIYIWTKEEMHINEKKRIEEKTWHLNWNRTLCME
jgi:hypothetical protein